MSMVVSLSPEGDTSFFDDWVSVAMQHGDPNWNLQTLSLLAPGDLDYLTRHLGRDPDHFAIIDTGSQVSAVRSCALACADLVLMQFSGFLEAGIGVELAGAQIPRNQNLVAVQCAAGEETIRDVTRWMPVMSAPYPVVGVRPCWLHSGAPPAWPVSHRFASLTRKTV